MWVNNILDENVCLYSNIYHEYRIYGTHLSRLNTILCYKNIKCQDLYVLIVLNIRILQGKCTFVQTMTETDSLRGHNSQIFAKFQKHKSSMACLQHR